MAKNKNKRAFRGGSPGFVIECWGMIFHAYKYVHAHTCMHACTHTHTHTDTHTNIHTRVCVHTHTQNLLSHTQACIHVCLNVFRSTMLQACRRKCWTPGRQLQTCWKGVEPKWRRWPFPTPSIPSRATTSCAVVKSLPTWHAMMALNLVGVPEIAQLCLLRGTDKSIQKIFLGMKHTLCCRWLANCLLSLAMVGFIIASETDRRPSVFVHW